MASKEKIHVLSAATEGFLVARTKAVFDLTKIAPAFLDNVRINRRTLEDYILGAEFVIEGDGLKSDAFSLSALYPDKSALTYKRMETRFLTDVKGRDSIQLMFFDLREPSAPNKGKTLFCVWEGEAKGPLNSLYINFVDTGSHFRVENSQVERLAAYGHMLPPIDAKVTMDPDGPLVRISHNGFPNPENRGRLIVPATLVNPRAK